MAKEPNPMRDVVKETRKLNEIVAALDIDDIDLETLAIIVEGETDLNEAIMALVEIVQHYEQTLIMGLKNRIDALTARKNRMQKSAENYRALILQTMERTGQDKIVGDTCTLSARDVRRGLVVEDEELVPSKYWVSQDPKLDKKALLADVVQREQEIDAFDPEAPGDTPPEPIPGARLDNGGRTLSIRIK